MNLWLLTSTADSAAAAAIHQQLAALGALTILAPGERTDSAPHCFRSRRAIPPASQRADDPSFPYNLMAPELALSYELAQAADQLVAEQGQPDVLVCSAEDALAYFLLQRRLTNLSSLAGVPLVVVASAACFALVEARLSSYRFPQYWLGRLEQFCLRGADAIVAADAECQSRILRHIPDITTPIVLPDALATLLTQITTTYQPPTRFPSNTPSAQGAVLPPSRDCVRGLLSVVVPFYNLGQYVAATIESLAHSDYQPMEVLVVDDGSRPAERAILDQVVAAYPDLVRVIAQPNSGLARTRNAGAEQAHGEFLAFLDADDTVMPTYFSKAIAVLQRHTNVSFVSAWMQLFDALDVCIPCWNPEFPFLLGRNMLAMNSLFRRADFLAYGRNDPGFTIAFEDHESWIRLLRNGCVGVVLPETLFCYRIRDNSMLRSADSDVQRYLMEQIMARHADLYRQYGAELFALQNTNGAALLWNQPGAETIDYRARFHESDAAYRRLRQRLTIFDPLVQFARWLKWW